MAQMNRRIWSWWHPTLSLYTDVHTHIHTWDKRRNPHETTSHCTAVTNLNQGWLSSGETDTPDPLSHCLSVWVGSYSRHHCWPHLHWWALPLVGASLLRVYQASPTSWTKEWSLYCWRSINNLTTNSLTPPSFLVLYLRTPQLSLRSLHLLYLQGLWSSRCTSMQKQRARREFIYKKRTSAVATRKL